MRRDLVTVGQLYLEVRIGQRLNYDSLKFYNIAFRQKNPSSSIKFRQQDHTVRRDRHRVLIVG